MRAPSRLTPLLAVPILLALGAGPGGAQLRPLDPLDWDALETVGHVVTVGTGVYWGQRASRAGSEGRLVELGRFRAVWGLGRMSVELAGTARWLFDERTTFAEPVEGVLPADGTRREDSGDYRVSTVIRLTPSESNERSALGLRFGARLPTTDGLQGLDRDLTDFFALLGARTGAGPVGVGAEIGLGVFGTRASGKQVDVLLFGLRATLDLGAARPFLELAGQHDTRAGPDFRGNEDLGEGRLGVQLGRARWLGLSVVRGWTPASPELGLTFEVGKRF